MTIFINSKYKSKMNSQLKDGKERKPNSRMNYNTNLSAAVGSMGLKMEYGRVFDLLFYLLMWQKDHFERFDNRFFTSRDYFDLNV